MAGFQNTNTDYEDQRLNTFNYLLRPHGWSSVLSLIRLKATSIIWPKPVALMLFAYISVNREKLKNELLNQFIISGLHKAKKQGMEPHLIPALLVALLYRILNNIFIHFEFFHEIHICHTFLTNFEIVCLNINYCMFFLNNIPWWLRRDFTLALTLEQDSLWLVF